MWVGLVVRSDGPRPPRRWHRGGMPFLVPSKTSGRLQERDNASSGGEDCTLNCGGSYGVSCARGGRWQVSSSAG